MYNTSNKLIQTLVYLANSQKDRTMDNMKAYKLIWIADRLHLRKYGRTITGDKYFAMPLGVVPSDAKNILEHHTTNLVTDKAYMKEYLEPLKMHSYKALKEPDCKEFSESDREVLDMTIRRFSKYKPMELSAMSHSFPEWLKYKSMIEDDKEKNAFPINMDLFFEESGDASNAFFAVDEGVLEVTKEMYHEYAR